PEGGVRAHVEGRSIPAPEMLRDADVDPLARQQEPRPGPQVGGWIAEALAPAVPGHDLAVEHEPATERHGWPLEIARRKRLTYRGRGHRPAVDLDERHRLGGEPERCAEPRQRLHRPAGLEPEREVRAHYRVARVGPADEGVLYEGLGRDEREIAVE